MLSAARIWPHGSGRVCLGTWRFPSASGGLPPRLLPPSGGLGSLPGAWGAPNKGNAEGAEGIFDKLRARVGYGPAPGPTQKRPCAIHARKVGRASNTADHSRSEPLLVPYMPVRSGGACIKGMPKYRRSHLDLNLNLSRCRVALRPAVLSAARIWPSVSRYLEISFGLRGPSPQAFTPFRGGLGSLPGAWGAPNKGNAEGAEGIFDKLRARVGYGPAPGPTQKKALCHTCP